MAHDLFQAWCHSFLSAMSLHSDALCEFERRDEKWHDCTCYTIPHHTSKFNVMLLYKWFLAESIQTFVSPLKPGLWLGLVLNMVSVMAVLTPLHLASWRRFLLPGWKLRTRRVSREKRVTVCEIADAPSSLKIWRVEVFWWLPWCQEKGRIQKRKCQLADVQKINCRHSWNLTNIYSSWTV